MSIIDEPLIVLTFPTMTHVYVMAFDPRDLSAAYYRGSPKGGRGVGTNRDSLPDDVRVLFARESHRLAEEWNAAHPEEEPAPSVATCEHGRPGCRAEDPHEPADCWSDEPAPVVGTGE